MNRFRRNTSLSSIGKSHHSDPKFWIDIFPYPSLLIDAPSQKIIYANTKFLDLSGLNLSDTVNLFISDIFIDWSESTYSSFGQSIIDRPTSYISLKLKNGDLIQVKVTQYKKTIDKELYFLSLETIRPVDQQAQLGKGGDQAHIWQNISNIFSDKPFSSVSDALESILAIGQDLTSANCAAIYLAEKDNPSLQITEKYGDFEWLPSMLLPEDVNRLGSNYLWKPARRQLSTLHRLARLSGINYLSTAPIGNKNALIGILLFADRDKEPLPDISEITGLIAKAIASAIQIHLNTQHLQEKIDSLLTQIKIQEIIEQSVRVGILHLDSDLNIIKMNRSAEKILGYNASETEKSNANFILLGSENLEQTLLNAKKGLSANNIGTIRLYRRSGEFFPAHASVIAIKGNNTPTKILVLISDLSEQQKFQEQAEKLEQHAFLGEVSAIFAHEVRNPINNLSTGLDLLESNLPENDSNRDLVSRLRQDCNRFEDLMNSILTFSKHTDYIMVKVDILYMLTRILEQFHPRMEKYHIKSQIHAPDNLPFVRGNFRALEQVFTNIIDNAIQAMKEKGGQLAIKIQEQPAKDEKGLLEISIADTGAGMGETELERLFQPFFTTKGSGTGLGLAISKRIITAHKGTIIAQSFPGCSIFQVQIPIAQGSEELE